MNKLFSGLICWMALIFAAGAQSTNAVVPRAGKPGPPMLLGTSVMGPTENEIVKSIGFSHSQTDSDHLTVNEPQPDDWDWTNADAGLAAMQKAGMKWQYFPHFHWAPEWYQHDPKFVASVGLRSHRKIAAMSIWSPDIVPWFDHCYAALAQHYGSGTSNLYAIYLGIHGDFGETLFPMGFHPDEVKRFGEKGTATYDFWCGDNHARNDFRQWARHKYHSLARLNETWGTSFTEFSQIEYPPTASNASAPIPDTPQGRRYWLDFLQWYYDSMTKYTGEVCKIARHYFPHTLLQIPIGGGCEDVRFGQDTSALPKIARRYDVDVRSTHGGFKPFPENYAGMIKRIATASKFYGAPHWLEPPGAITPEGEVSRIMEAISCGNRGFWDWGANPVMAQNVFREYTNYLTQEEPVVDVALFFPTTDHRLHPDVIFPLQLQSTGIQLRDVMDFDMVDEELIADNALKNYRVLIWAEGKFIEKKSLEKIAAWIDRGGVLLCQADSPPETIEGDTQPGMVLFGLHNSPASERFAITNTAFLRHLSGKPETGTVWAVRHGKGWVIIASQLSATEFNKLACDVVYNLSTLDPTKKDALEVDGVADGVYATLLANGEVILFNYNSEPRQKTVGATTITLPPKSLRSVLLH